MKDVPDVTNVSDINVIHNDNASDDTTLVTDVETVMDGSLTS